MKLEENNGGYLSKGIDYKLEPWFKFLFLMSFGVWVGLIGMLVSSLVAFKVILIVSLVSIIGFSIIKSF